MGFYVHVHIRTDIVGRPASLSLSLLFEPADSVDILPGVLYTLSS